MEDLMYETVEAVISVHGHIYFERSENLIGLLESKGIPRTLNQSSVIVVKTFALKALYYISLYYGGVIVR